MMEKAAVKQARLVNCSNLHLLQDKAKPHTAQWTVAKLEKLLLKCLPHPPYYTDNPQIHRYHVFRN